MNHGSTQHLPAIVATPTYSAHAKNACASERFPRVLLTCCCEWGDVTMIIVVVYACTCLTKSAASDSRLNCVPNMPTKRHGVATPTSMSCSMLQGRKRPRRMSLPSLDGTIARGSSSRPGRAAWRQWTHLPVGVALRCMNVAIQVAFSVNASLPIAKSRSRARCSRSAGSSIASMSASSCRARV